ncbi:phenylacetate-coenzyme A ligase PaaK-like adenylate-forming protein [Aminivibrio pyruvatiphilus]|uniref:Phenylacetate-coenzyme A ligase PaaK-like adenylate-forming protein n=1 Tax=Aminivibrio pyruvatiphilus TaxID=1005740 RepID=A0A4R8M7Z5_9BACT|nr:AMP-binding protein [Aminivibrio pyruvatiphilus]TDY61639.1 phenylacetate-coenzyme A ligase PaaK-like adenylate-forming protein [Aminivibrio pyruvatiphilus]
MNTPFPFDVRAARKAGGRTDRGSLDDSRLEALRAAVGRARRTSPFYRGLLSPFPEGFPRSMEEYGGMPFTSAGDLSKDPMSFLAVSQNDVARIVTARSSGTTGTPKRVFFTEGDLEKTRSIFAEGMTALVPRGSRVLILLPGERPGSVGDLLVRGLAPEMEGVLCSCPDAEDTLNTIARLRPDCLVALPSQALRLARHSLSPLGKCLSSVLLCSDYASDSLAAAVAGAWDCTPFRHYGLTETGYGGALSCGEGQGMHVMEDSFFFEIVSPGTGETLPAGEEGEIVCSSLNAEGTPLLRYRTGDTGRFLPGTCSCGSFLRKISVKGRLANGLVLPGGFVSLADLDEVLFSLPWLGGYEVRIRGQFPVFSLDVPSLPDGVVSLPEDFEREAGNKLRPLPGLEKLLPGTEFRLTSLQDVDMAPAKRLVLPEALPRRPE